MVVQCLEIKILYELNVYAFVPEIKLLDVRDVNKVRRYVIRTNGGCESENHTKKELLYCISFLSIFRIIR